MTGHVLDDFIGNALRGGHHGFAIGGPGVLRYDPAVAVFGAVEPGSDLRALDGLPTDDVVLATRAPVEVPDGWTRTLGFEVFQMVAEGVGESSADPIGTPLTAEDVPEMLALVELTHPGPFAVRTIELGGYLGVREGGRLVAMAGRRVAPTGWTEISAVCTHPDFRGRGWGGRLLLEVLQGIRADDREGFLTVLDGNPAQGLYESLGFAVRQRFSMARLARAV